MLVTLGLKGLMSFEKHRAKQSDKSDDVTTQLSEGHPVPTNKKSDLSSSPNISYQGVPLEEAQTKWIVSCH